MEKKEILRSAVALMIAAFLVLPIPSALCESYQDGVYQDLAPGYNDDVIVTVTVRDGRITELSAKNRNGEESEYFKKAEEGLRTAIVEKQGIDGVEAVSGATGTSESILSAMKGVLEQAVTKGDFASAGPQSAGSQSAGSQSAGSPSAGSQSAGPRPTLNPEKAEVFVGLGSVANFRSGPGKDEKEVPVYSFNVTMASMVFDKEGRILDALVDIYEVATPNYDGASMPRFSGWPDKEGYNVTDTATGKVTGVSENTVESLTEEIAAWRTKRERGAEYGMNPTNEWYQQMNAYEQWMIGKTTAELRQWFEKYTSPRNGRPIKLTSDNEEDVKIIESLSDQEKQELTELTAMATMSLSDSHGWILEAIEKAYQNRTPVDQVEMD
ncbi:MAG: FMN-binding protein [Eubacteriales bacterium]|nr:FMN-binding protein [Eubacteriales bacterium]